MSKLIVKWGPCEIPKLVTPADVTYKRKFSQYLQLLPHLDKREPGTKVSEMNMANPVARQAGWRWQ